MRRYTLKCFQGSWKLLLASMIIWGISSVQVSAAIFTVTNLNDFGAGSFRQAITDANAFPGLDQIVFTVAGTINVNSALPLINDPVIIDGSSSPGYVLCTRPGIAIRGNGGTANGLVFLAGASGSGLLAINIQNFSLNGIQMINANNCVIAGCFIGTDLNGTAAAGNTLNGIQMEGNSNNNRIGGSTSCERNVISGNGGTGIAVNACSQDSIMGNYVGLNIGGTAAIANGGPGINIFGAGSAHVVGGSTLGQGNVVAGNGSGLTGNGINIDANASCIIRGNLIGLDASGTVALGNAENGLALNAAPDCSIGGTGANEGNVIADHNFHAIVLNGGSNNVVVQGNRCGTNAAGTAVFGNDDSGVIVINTSGVTIGGSAAGAGNILSGSLSEYGIFLINADNCTVQGNLIGTDVTGTMGFPNFDGGIRNEFGSSQNTIGGSGAGEGNVIAFNTGYGVGVLSGSDTQVLISRNSMFCNTGEGIDLNNLGNNNHPAPVFGAISTTGVSGTATANNVIELFFDSLCTATCQGKDYIATVTADGAGNWSYTGAIPVGATVVATARDVAPPPSNANNTSEFSCVTLLPVEGWAFSGNRTGEGTVELNWSTVQEINNAYFDVERSADGLHFEAIGQVQGQGDDPNGHQYRFEDPLAPQEATFYRLRQVDFDGAFSFSNIVRVNESSDGNWLLVAPQPADQYLELSNFFPGSEAVRGTLFDVQGRAIQEFEAAPSSVLRLSTGDLPTGWYFVRMQLGSATVQAKVWIVH